MTATHQQLWNAFLSAKQAAIEAVSADAYPAAVMALHSKNELIRSAAFNGREKVGPNYLFPIASITKPILAVAVMQLVEQDDLALDSPVTDVLPDFGKPEITFWHLLTHTSGLDCEHLYRPELVTPQKPFRAYLQAAYNAEVKHPPGTCREYANIPFFLLAQAVTKVSGTPYIDYLRQNVLDPLGMERTAFYPVTPLQAAKVYGFYADPKMTMYLSELAAPHAGLWSSYDDLFKFGRAMLSHGAAPNGYQLLQPETVALMVDLHTEEVRGADDEKVYHGLSWDKPAVPAYPNAPAEAYFHGGATGSMLWIDPVNEFVFVFLSSHWDSESVHLRRIVNALYDSIEG